MVQQWVSSWRRVRFFALSASLVTFLYLGTSCTFDSSDCRPQCEGRVCGDDGCGSTCGTCLPGSRCEEGLCLSQESGIDCAQTCEDLAYQCGEHCDMSCGSCEYPNAICVDHRCECELDCTDRVCGAGDGCGGICGGCPNDINCESCELKLALMSDHIIDDERIVTLALDFRPSSSQLLPGLVDIRLETTGPALLQRVGLGKTLTDADKELFVHPFTGQPYQTLREGVYRFLLTSPRNNQRFAAGRWLFLRFSIPQDEDGPRQPTQFRLLREAPVFAPSAVDESLSAAAFANAVVLPLEVSNAQ